MSELYFNKLTAAEKLKEALKKVVRINSQGEVYIAVGALTSSSVGEVDEFEATASKKNDWGLSYTLAVKDDVIVNGSIVAPSTYELSIGTNVLTFTVDKYQYDEIMVKFR